MPVIGDAPDRGDRAQSDQKSKTNSSCQFLHERRAEAREHRIKQRRAPHNRRDAQYDIRPQSEARVFKENKGPLFEGLP